jgi:hypothetical protein
MGPLPTVRDQWVELVVRATDVGFFGSNWYGMSYDVAGGVVNWDMTTTMNTAVLTVTGLQKIASSGLTVKLYDPQNPATPIASGTQSGDLASFSLYQPSTTYKWNTFPIQGQLKVTDGSNNEYYFGPTRNIWPGDQLTYMGDSSFFKPTGAAFWPSSTIHTALLGSKKFSVDCLDAVLCYDMESMSEVKTYVGTGNIVFSMLDLSGKGNHGAANKPVLASVATSAAGLASSFDGTSSNLVTANTVLSGVTSSVTLSAWVYLPDTSRKGAFIKVGTGTNGYGIGVGGLYNGVGNWDTAGNLLVGLYENVRWINPGVSIVTGLHHVVMVIDAGGVPSFYRWVVSRVLVLWLQQQEPQ